jgi:hypothetical protein
MSDGEILEEVVTSGLRLHQAAQQKLASVPPIDDDKRWNAPIPLRFEAQLAVLFMGAIDAYDITTGILRHRASQQTFRGLRFRLESLALIRWLTEPTDHAARQHRAYKVVCGVITRWGKFLLPDAGKDRDALQGVRRVRMWREYLREIAAKDGIEHLKEPPDRPALLSNYAS